MSIYCVYLTTYMGNKMPMFYIGSTSTDKVLNQNYHGTVKSKMFSSIWRSELKTRPDLFKTTIISTYDTRKEALEVEYRLHKSLNVVKSEMYINMAMATKDGCFGRNVDGENNPFFGRNHSMGARSQMSLAKKGVRRPERCGVNSPMYGRTGDKNPMWGRKHSEEAIRINREAHTGKVRSEESKRKQSLSTTGRKLTPSHIAAVVDKISREWLVTHPDGRQTVEKNLKRFCRDNSLTQSIMSRVANGYIDNHKGYRCTRHVKSSD